MNPHELNQSCYPFGNSAGPMKNRLRVSDLREFANQICLDWLWVCFYLILAWFVEGVVGCILFPKYRNEALQSLTIGPNSIVNSVKQLRNSDQWCPQGRQNRSKGCPAEVPKTRSPNRHAWPGKGQANGSNMRTTIWKFGVFSLIRSIFVSHHCFDGVLMDVSIILVSNLAYFLCHF